MSTTWASGQDLHLGQPGGAGAAAESQKLCKLLADFDIYGFPRGLAKVFPLSPFDFPDRNSPASLLTAQSFSAIRLVFGYIWLMS